MKNKKITKKQKGGRINNITLKNFTDEQHIKLECPKDNALLAIIQSSKSLPDNIKNNYIVLVLFIDLVLY